MVTRWLKRSAWFLLLLALVIGPARLARGPVSAQAAEDNRNSIPFKDFSPAAAIVTTMSLFFLAALWLRRRQRLN